MRTFFLSLAFAALLPAVAAAGVVMLPPTPYLSADDSPFDRQGLGSTFFLEDFEDDTPQRGLWDDPQWQEIKDLGTDSFLLRTRGSSVDADDGLIDGSGRDGHIALAAKGVGAGFQITLYNEFYFDPEALGFYPKEVGFVVTDGRVSDLVPVVVFVSLYDIDGFEYQFSLRDLSLNRTTTSDDRFIGFSSTTGITHFTVRGWALLPNFSIYSVAVDHVQYGLGVPEPCSAALTVGAALSLLTRGRS